jgi:LacI family transcriptional regulator
MGIEEVCRRRGLRLLFAALPVDADNRAVELPALLIDDSLDGLLLVGTFFDQTLTAVPGRRSLQPALGSGTLPIVLVDGYSNTDLYDQVVSDNFRAAYRAVTYLIDKGHRQIGLVGGASDSYPSLRERRYGYLRALKEHQLSEHYTADFNINYSKGYDETIALLQEYPHLTALFCVNDDVASHALRAIKALGKSVPADVSIIGYDDTYIAQNTYPALTTMQVDTLAMGRAAMYLLDLRLTHPDSARMSLVIHPTLIERASVAPR